ncbi:MAG: PAS domain S-box protein [Methanomicrobiales archaeon]
MKRDITWWYFIAVCILIAGVILTIWSAQQIDQTMRTDLLTKTNLAISGVSTEKIQTLHGSTTDLASPEYLVLKAQLGKMRAADPDIRFAYLMGQREDGTIIFYIDSEPPESADYSPPGQVYTEAPVTISSTFVTGEKANQGPFTDRWGTWVSGFIPITDPSTGRVIAVFGMDTDARGWNSTVFRDSLPLLIATLLIVLLVLASAFFQRRNEEEKRRLATSEEKFSKAFHANPALMVLSTIEEGRILDVNDTFLATLGYSREEVIGRTTMDLKLYVDPAQRNTLLNQVRETGQMGNMEVKIYRKDRDLVSGLLTSITIDIDGTPRLFTAIINLTDRKRTEEALAESEEQFRGIFDSVNDGIHIHEIEPDGKPGKFIEVNEVACRMLGFSHDEMLEHGPLDFVTGYHNRPLNDIISELSSTGRSIFETEHRKKDGTIIPVEINAHVGSLKGKRVILAVVRDITERKRAEEALRQLSDRLSLATRAGGVGIWDYDVVNNTLAWDDQMFALYGITREQFSGAYDAWQTGLHPEDKQRGDDEIQMALRGEKEFNTVFRVLWPDGSIRTIRALAIVQRDTGGKPLRMIGTNWDITELKQVEEDLRKSEEKIRLLLNSAAEAIYGIDMAGNCTFCNNSCLHLLGYKRQDELLGRNMHWQIHGKHPDGTHFPVEECRIFRAFQKGEGSHVDDEVLWRADGTSFPAEYWSYPQWDDGAVIGAVVTFLDITERKELENEMKFHEMELRQFSKSLATANKKLTLLSSITRHDINNQLTVLMGYLSILQDMPPGPSRDEYFQKVTTAAEQISVMIRFTKEYESIGVTAPSWQECRTLVNTAAKEAPLGKVMLKNDLAAGAEIFADPLIVKVCYNLMDNAVRYGGKITFIRFSAEERGDVKVLVCEDDGEGISAAEKEKIFERGFGKNTGLGLALAREILDITGISIKETGEPGKGARFEMTVPAGAWRIQGVKV